MISLRHLAQSAMLGCDTPEAAAALATQGLKAPDPETALLSAAALAGTARMAGQCPVALALPKSPAPPMGEGCLPEAAADLFRRILAGNDRKLLAEFMAEINARGLAVPPEALPDLLGCARRDSALTDAVLGVIGPRGRWLADQNPAWDFARGRDPETAWEEGEVGVRLRALREMRILDAAAAREWVKSTWEDDRPEDRAAFLSAFEIGLSMADAPFLESCLKDSRQEVRCGAAALLICLPESGFVQRIWEHARGALRLEKARLKKVALQVVIPDNLDEVITSHGLNFLFQRLVSYKLQTYIDKSSARLAQMLAFVPPVFWTRTFEQPPEVLIDLALAAADWDKGILLGWLLAAHQAQDSDWGEALLRRWITDSKSQLTLRFFPMAEILAVLEMPLIEQIVTETTLLKGRKLTRGYPPLSILCSMNRPWTVKLARIIIKGFQEMSSEQSASAAPYLAEAAYLVPPELTAEFTSGWPQKTMPAWKKQIGKFGRVLSLRRDIRKTLG